MNIFEAIMLICFGVSWPISISKSIRTGKVSGKSPLFMMIVCFGYFCGVVHKVLNDYDWITYLYALNLLMVFTDLMLYYHYLPLEKKSAELPAGNGGVK